MKDDNISRQAAIEALGEEPEVWSGRDEYEQGLNNQWHYDRNAIKAVPSVDAINRSQLIETIKHYAQYPDGIHKLLAVYAERRTDE